jgi:hypothetical protein
MRRSKMGIAIVDKKTGRKVGGTSGKGSPKVGEKLRGSGRNLAPRDAKPFREKLINSTAAKIAKAADPGGRLSKQDMARAMSIARGMLAPQEKKSGGKVKKAKGMAKGGKMKSKGYAKGGKTMMKKSKGMARGGKAMMKKSKGMARGGRMMKKSKGMARGGKAKR